MPFHEDLTLSTELHVPAEPKSSDPGSVGAYKGWIDHGVDGTAAAPVLKIRNGTNAGWVRVGTAAESTDSILANRVFGA